MDFDIIDDFLIAEEVNIFQSTFNSEYSLEYNVRNRIHHFNQWDEREFLRRFRLNKSTVTELLSLVYDKLKNETQRNHSVRPIDQLLMALRFYATGSFYQAVGDFGGVHKSTASKIIHRVTSAIAALRPLYIKLPVSIEDIHKTQHGFYNIARFPRVIGAIDCTHLKILSPGGEQAETFRNRKGYFSLNVQVMCDSDMMITDIVARWPGSSHDSNIFDNSLIRARFESGQYGNGLILGDGGYPLRPYLITPIANPVSIGETRFNESQIRTRNVVERCFGVWKRRFPVIHSGLRCKLPLAQDIAVCTAVLHNIARQQSNEDPPGETSTEEDESSVDPLQAVSENNVRRELVDYFGAL